MNKLYFYVRNFKGDNHLLNFIKKFSPQVCMDKNSWNNDPMTVMIAVWLVPGAYSLDQDD